ncbi:MAG: MmgE/PrpD family protein [Proteobacteria bacterium]|nr:MmgE/PrpD family protein [Pseudomonadota bacterium]
MNHNILDFIHEENPCFSDELYNQAKRCLIDTLGVAIAARTTKTSQILEQFAKSQFGATNESSATLLFSDQKSSECGAALYGAGSIDSLDAHDGQVLTKGHIGVVIIPTLFAMPETANLSGKELLDAIIIGYEIGTRAGIALHATACDYHTSGAWNALVAAALVARVKKMSHADTYEALGLAEYHGPRSQMMRCIDNPIMAKDGSCWGALSGFSAALLARDGFTGAPAVTMFNDDVAEIWADLGKRFYTFEQYIKAYPVCRWAQPAVEGALSIKSEHEIDVSNIKNINVHTFHEAKRLHTKVPKDTDQAQYSLPFSVACALRDNTVSVKAITDDLHDPILLQLSDKVNCIENDKYNTLFPAERWAHVTIELYDGRVLSSPPGIARGNPENPLSDAEIKEKFFELARSGKTHAECERLFDIVMTISAQSSVRTLTQLLQTSQ